MFIPVITLPQNHWVRVYNYKTRGKQLHVNLHQVSLPELGRLSQGIHGHVEEKVYPSQSHWSEGCIKRLLFT